jgi:3-hydroxymyristoyl/3-hydroxydecanoyl-(acyl carrier protein) dehydratase
VLPGDTLIIECKTLKRKETVVKMQGTAKVNGQVVAEGIVMCKLIDRPAPAEAQG